MNPRLLSAGCVCWIIVSHAIFASEEPRLSISNSRDEIIVSWPTTASNWVLEAASALSLSPSAILVTPPYETNGSWISKRLALPAVDSGNRFYRLRRLMPAVGGLSGHWSLDEGVGETSGDQSGSGTVLFATGTTWGQGRFGNGALRFLGGGSSRAWVSNDNPGALPGSGGPFTLSLWLNPDSLAAGWSALAGNDTTGTGGWRLALHTPSTGTNRLIFNSAGPGASLSVTGQVLMLPGQWHQVTVTHDGSEGAIYFDNEILARGPGQIPAQAGPLYLGGGLTGLPGFLGRIDEVRTYTNCLSPDQIALSGHWRFEENSGGFTADSSVNGHYARVTDPSAWVPGRDGTGIDLSCGQVWIGNREHKVLPPTGGSFSVSLWLRPGALGNGRHGLMHCGSGSEGADGWQLAVDVEPSGSQQLHWVSTNSGGTLDLRVPATLSEGEWTKLELTFNGGIATLYSNGRKIGAGSGAIRASPTALILGAVPGTLDFNGVIDEVKVHSRERGEGEVGPFAPVMWETVLRNTMTNIVIPGSGPAGKILTYSIVPLITPTNGTVTIAEGEASFTYVAGARKGPDAFTYTVSDGEFTSAPAMVIMSVVEPHWLSPGGGPAEPRDGASPERSWTAGTAAALDAIWRTNNYYDCFFYSPGVYETKGYRYFERSTANVGCKHIGAGSEGPFRTTIKLVDIWAAWGEETIFSPLYPGKTTDNFEVHNMLLDCNATNVPKYIKGEPVWIRIPLASTGQVESVSLRWGQGGVTGNGNIFRPAGPAKEFSIEALRSDANGYVTNRFTSTRTGQVDTVRVGSVADELVIQLERRLDGFDFYALSEVEVSGATISRPTATLPGGGASRLDAQHHFLLATDGDAGTWWASGPESMVEFHLPLNPGTAVSEVQLNWNCRNLTGTGRAGPAADYSIQARDELTGQWFNVPFSRQFRNASGKETAVFGSSQFPMGVVTDQLKVLLTEREASVDFYSLREVTLHHAGRSVSLRQPSALNFLSYGREYPIRQAFDGDPDTCWASATQGMVGAMNVSGSNLKFSRLKVIGFGTRALRECFPMFLNPQNQAARPQLGNVLVDQCVFSDPAPSNEDGVTVVALAGTTFVSLTNAVVRRCSFIGLRSHFPTTQATSATQVENCTVSDCSIGVYFEPEPIIQEIIGPVLVRSNQFYNVDSAVFLAMHPGTRFGTITLLRNEIVLIPRRGWGFSICDACYLGPGGTVTNVTALDNLVRYADWELRPSNFEGGFAYTDIHHAVYGNNKIFLGGNNDLGIRPCPAGLVQPPGIPEDCDNLMSTPAGPSTNLPCLEPLLPGYKRSWFNNRNASGSLSEIRINSHGVHRLAQPQQWRD